MSTYFGDVYVLLMQTITLLRAVYFVRITNGWCRTLILSLYVTYIIYYKHKMVRC